MRIKVTGHGVEITDALRNYVLEKVSKLEEFFANIQKAEVVLDARKIDNAERRQVVEIRAWAAGLKVIQAREGGRDIYAALDLALEEAKRQIEKHKEKHVEEQRRKAEKVKQLSRELPKVKFETGPMLVRVSRFAHKPMTFEEAASELKTLGQDFLVFRNTENKEVNLVRRNQDKVELLRPEKELTAEQAIQELARTGENLIIFNNSSTHLPSVIFRRKTGNFGLIEPEL
ncbi:MAG: ribosome hibernation-promoting factor, HPF/YfiA family [Candidatus Margulisiibacteriota bacterium]